MIHNIINSRKKISGITTVSMSIAMVVAGMLTLASARYAINKFNENRGNLVGNQLQTVADALEAYIEANNAALSKAETRAGVFDKKTVKISYLPSIKDLKDDRHLTSNFSTTPSYGGNYVIKIEVTPRSPSNVYPCVNDCNIRGFVYLSEPITSSGSTTDIRILGAAVNASTKKHVGFSLPQTPNLITGPGGWTETNPDTKSPKRAGILLAVTTLSNDNSNFQYWLKPAMNSQSLPPSTNFDGDGRIALDTYKPFIWNGSATTPKWMELFSNSETQSLSIGTESGSTDSTSAVTSDTKNTFIGYQAGRFNSGSSNLFIGPFSGTNSSLGSSNIFIGPSSGQFNKSIPTPPSSASNNIFMGASSGLNNNGFSNIFIGPNSGEKNTTGYENIFLGTESGKNNSIGNKNIFIGTKSGHRNNGNSNIFIGYEAGQINSGSSNAFIGDSSGIFSTGDSNSFFGHLSGNINSSGKENTFTGYNSGNLNSSGSYNVYTGFKAGISLNGSYNTSIGHNSGYNTNTAVNSISSITAIGSSANTEAQYATAIGSNSKARSEKSTSIGSSAFVSPNAINSTAIGYSANVNGNNSTAIGNDTQVDKENSVAIGNGTIAKDPNTVVIGNKEIKTVYIGSGIAELKTASVDKSSSVTLTSTGNIIATGNINSNTITTTNIICPTCTSLPTGSDKRLKDNITDTPRDLSFIKKLRPVDYTLISNGQPQTGFIAQEVESADPAFPGIVKPKNDRDFYALSYTAFIPAIVKSIQQLDTRLDKLAPAPSTTTPASVSGLANGAAPAPASADLSLLKWLVLFLSVCVLACVAVIVRFYKELQAMRLSVQRLHALAA